jgi:hypothetical protein
MGSAAADRVACRQLGQANARQERDLSDNQTHDIPQRALGGAAEEKCCCSRSKAAAGQRPQSGAVCGAGVRLIHLSYSLSTSEPAESCCTKKAIEAGGCWRQEQLDVGELTTRVAGVCRTVKACERGYQSPQKQCTPLLVVVRPRHYCTNHSAAQLNVWAQNTNADHAQNKTPLPAAQSTSSSHTRHHLEPRVFALHDAALPFQAVAARCATQPATASTP